MHKYVLVFLLLILSSFTLQAADNFADSFDYKKHLAQNRYDLDTNASAIVLYERVTFSLVEKNPGAKTVATVRKIIKILNDKGLQYADVFVPVYSTNGRYDFRNVKGKTYNLHNGEVTVTAIDKKDVVTEGIQRKVYVEKFSLPNVVAGSIIAYSYEVETAFTTQLGSWEFQEELPKLYSEVVCHYPTAFQIAILSKTKKPFKEVSPADKESTWTDTYVKEGTSLGASYRCNIWIRKNIPALVAEPHNYNIRNYTEKIELQVVGTNQQKVTRTLAATSFYSWSFDLSSWKGLNERLYQEMYGPYHHEGPIDRIKEKNRERERTGKLQTHVLAARGKIVDSLEIAQRIFAYVRDNFEMYDGLWEWDRDELMEDIEKKKLDKSQAVHLLQRMLDIAGFKSNAVLLGTRQEQRLISSVPILDRINHTVCRVVVGNAVYFLDPSEKYNPFGVLSPECYNGFAWVIDSAGYGIVLDPATPLERTLYMFKSEMLDSNTFTAEVTRYYGNIAGPLLRRKWRQDTSLVQRTVQAEVDGFPIKSTSTGYKVTGLENADTTLQITYKMTFDWPLEQTIFFTPSIYNYYTENPFKANERHTPIELPYSVDMNFMLTMALPKDYRAENLPSSIVYKFDDDNTYKYTVAYKAENNSLSTLTKLRMNRTYFDVAEYETLKTFFDKIIEQQQKPCILKKL